MSFHVKLPTLGPFYLSVIKKWPKNSSNELLSVAVFAIKFNY